MSNRYAGLSDDIRVRAHAYDKYSKKGFGAKKTARVMTCKFGKHVPFEDFVCFIESIVKEFVTGLVGSNLENFCVQIVACYIPDWTRNDMVPFEDFAFRWMKREYSRRTSVENRQRSKSTNVVWISPQDPIFYALNVETEKRSIYSDYLAKGSIDYLIL